MEHYLENMKTLRSYVNDVEEEAVKRSAEEQKQRTAIVALESDLNLVRSETKQLNEEAEEMLKKKAVVGLEIAEKQRKITSLQTECSTLKQTLELLHQEIASMERILKEKRSYYKKAEEELNYKLQEQQDWFHSHTQKMPVNIEPVENIPSMQGSIEGSMDCALHLQMTEKQKELTIQLESTKLKMEELETKKIALLSENCRNKQLIEQVKHAIGGFPRELREMDLSALEAEHNALLCDKSGETEYTESLQDRINQMKGISDTVECRCGEKYKVELELAGEVI
ncbi:outer dense fiber protein 2-like isoform X2 [Ananas comosus]|uniref:Outer dense fiber protein 2-like isoform X2 n=1 Tax=Ananas comosus TaxID=4615 RepID=A0A6P5G3V5_ANACO|nr:outer dense fiber protein 2-like isoform X2 [Ananas comosus]